MAELGNKDVISSISLRLLKTNSSAVPPVRDDILWFARYLERIHGFHANSVSLLAGSKRVDLLKLSLVNFAKVTSFKLQDDLESIYHGLYSAAK